MVASARRRGREQTSGSAETDFRPSIHSYALPESSLNSGAHPTGRTPEFRECDTRSASKYLSLLVLISPPWTLCQRSPATAQRVTAFGTDIRPAELLGWVGNGRLVTVEIGRSNSPDRMRGPGELEPSLRRRDPRQ
jgi:hypothetical protein